MANAINFIAFQIGWFACVMGAAYGWPWLGTGIALIVILLHLSRAQNPLPESVLIILAGLIGLVFDSLLVTLGWLSYHSGTLVSGTAPHWIVALWMLFATTLNVSLRWLRTRWILAFVLGAIAGPLAYVAGNKFGALQFVQPTPGLLALALGWAIAMPALMALAQRLDGMVPARYQKQAS